MNSVTTNTAGTATSVTMSTAWGWREQGGTAGGREPRETPPSPDVAAGAKSIPTERTSV